MNAQIVPDTRGLVPAIHVFSAAKQGVDGRNESGHDVEGYLVYCFSAPRLPLRLPLRAVFLHERLDHVDGLHGVGGEGVLVDEGVALAFQELQVHDPAG
jgi:hypothetical protein